jgi:hypothetical protein
MYNGFKGYIWPVTADWGLKVFNEESGIFEYGYSRTRFPQKGDFIIFYHDKHLIGSVPVIKSSGTVGPNEAYSKQNLRKKEWKYAVALDFGDKIDFSPAIPIKDLTKTLRVLKDKKGRQLHDACRMAPIISKDEYAALLAKINFNSKK